MNYTTLNNQETKLPEGTYRLRKGETSTPAIVRDGKVRLLLQGALLDGKVSYKRLG